MKDNGGPAFPYAVPEGVFHREGMTLLDWFAGQALMGLLANNNLCGQAVVSAYEVAHMMLDERKKYDVQC